MPQNDLVLHFNFMVARIILAAKALGFSAEECLKGTGLTAADIFEHNRMISIRQEYLVLANFREMINDDTWGLKSYQHHKSSILALGIYGYAIMSAPTTRDALYFAQQGTRITSSIYCYSLTEKKGLASLYLHPKYDFEECIQLRCDSEMAAVLAHLEILGGDNLQLRKVYVMHNGQASMETYQQFFGCDVEFNYPSIRVDFDAKVLDIPRPNGDKDVFNFCSERCLHNIELIYSRQLPMSKQVKAILEKQKRFTITAADIAAELHISGRTLSRKLQQEGSGFKDLLAEVRMNTAINFLVNSDLLMEEIAYKLDFSSQSAFTHSFKRWTGVAPIEYREGNQR